MERAEARIAPPLNHRLNHFVDQLHRVSIVLMLLVAYGQIEFQPPDIVVMLYCTMVGRQVHLGYQALNLGQLI